MSGVLIGCLYLPNGNPVGGPKFAYKLGWMERFMARAKTLVKLDCPVVLAGDYNIIPTERDVYKPERWLDDALFQPGPRAQYAKLLKQGWTDALRHLHPDETIFTFWDYWRQSFARNAGIRIDHLLLNRAAAKRLAGGGRRPRDTRARKGQRPCAGVGGTEGLDGPRNQCAGSKSTYIPSGRRGGLGARYDRNQMRNALASSGNTEFMGPGFRRDDYLEPAFAPVAQPPTPATSS